MLIYALNFLLGIVLFSYKNTLEISSSELAIIFTIFLLILSLFRRFKALSINIIIFALGFAWMGVFSSSIINGKIKDIYLNKSINITGLISELPEISSEKTKFIFNVTDPFKGKIKLSWYGKNLPTIRTGDKWNLTVKLKNNNGYQNIGGFDYERWLFYQQIDATGYVKSSNNNKLLEKSQGFSINEIRQDTRNFLQKFLSKLEFGGVINAVIVGDRSFIDKHNWELFKSTNTTHLSVISGLHIGLISGFVFLLASFVSRKCRVCTSHTPSQIIGSYFGIISALLYALIAGFSIPTQRAFIMASVVFISIILRRHHNIWQLYAIALILVLIVNPVSIFSVGFWLSFYVVAVIIYAASRHKNSHWLYRLIYIQILISIATIPLIAWFFSQGSMLSPIANLIAIPIFSFITTPVSLIGALFSLMHLDYLAKFAFEISNQSLMYLSYILEYLQGFSFNKWRYTQTSSIDLIILIVSVITLILPKQLQLRKLSVLLLILVLYSPTPIPNKNSVLITTLDVGQGLAIVVQTKNHTLLFDTGAAYPSGFNMGDSVINPYLKSKQIKSLDKIIISHGDNDHIGGLDSVLMEFNTDEILSSVPNKIKHNAKTCSSIESWNWDNVIFEMLNINNSFIGNNGSCVLKISTNKHSILLSADIEKKAERHLVETIGDRLRSDILIAPHHGSKTSSSDKFLQKVRPKFVIISSGYKNRFKHPAKIVMDRYKVNNISTINTNCAGQIDVYLDNSIKINKYRKDYARYYMRQC